MQDPRQAQGAPVVVLSNDFLQTIQSRLDLISFIDTNTKRESGRKAQLGNITTPKIFKLFIKILLSTIKSIKINLKYL